MEKIVIVGLGYIGLPTALLFAEAGYSVTGVDIDKKKVDNLQNGNLPFKENGLDGLFKKAQDNFKATNNFSSTYIK